MISPIFAPPQPEAFTAKAARTTPEQGAGGATAPEFAQALRKHAPAAKTSSTAEPARPESELAPSDAQESTASAQEATDDKAVSETETPVSDEIVEKDEPSSETPSDGVAAEAEAEPSELLVAAPVQSHAQPSSAEPVAEARSENPLQSVDARHLDAASAKSARSDDTEVVSPRTLPAAAQESAASPTNAPAATESASEQSERPQAATVAAVNPQAAPVRAPSPKSSSEHSVEVAETASAVDKPVETTASVRLQPVETGQSGADVNHRPAESRPFIEIVQRAEASSAGAPSAPEPSAENKLFTAQVSRGLEAALRQNGGSVTIRLKPETLGAIRIDLQVQQGAIAAQFEASTAEARELLNKNLATLRTALEAKGFGVRSVDVQVASPSQGSQANNEFGRPTSEGHAQPRDAGADGHGQSSSRREDPGGFSWDQRSLDALTEDELVGTKWRSVYVGGSLNTVA